MKKQCQCKTCTNQNKTAKYCRKLEEYCSGDCKNCKGETDCIYYNDDGSMGD
jgi:hypothetical protein